MEKKQKKEYAKVIILSVLTILMTLSMLFNSQISLGIKTILYKANIKVSADDLVVHFINVGQGDAIALRFPNEKVMLIDSGPKAGQNTLVEYIKNDVLSSNNTLTIDYMILTHPDADHSGGMSAVFSNFEVKCFFRPNIASASENLDYPMESSTEEYDEVIKMANQENALDINVLDNEFEFCEGEVVVQIFSPLKTYSTTNSMSPIIKVSYLGKSFLFVGDIQADAEKDMLDKYGEMLDADVLKVAHHGSDTSTSAEFLDIVSPQYAVICVGQNNYGHPNMSTIERLNDCGAKIFKTDNNKVRMVCGNEMFGLLDANTHHSFEFLQWWNIALIIIVIFAILIVKSVIIIIKYKSNKEI